MDALTRIAADRKQLEQKIARLQGQLDAARRELEDLDAAARVLKRYTPNPTVSGTADPATGSDATAKPTQLSNIFGYRPVEPQHSGQPAGEPAAGSEAERILSIVRAHPHGVDQTGLRKAFGFKYGFEPKPNTVTTTLGRLKHRGLIRIEGRRWFPASGIPDEGNPDAGASGQTSMMD